MGILSKFIKKNFQAGDTPEDAGYLFTGGKIKGADGPPKLQLNQTSEENKEEHTDKKTDRSVDIETPKAQVKPIPGTIKQVNKKLLEEWEQWLRMERNRAEGTVHGYISDLRIFSKFLLAHRNVSLKSATSEDVRALVRELRNKGCGPAGVNRRLAAIKVFYSWTMREGYMKQNPASPDFIDRLRVPERLPIHLTDEEHEDFMKSLEQYEAKGRAFIALMNLSGLRISEVCSLKTSHLVREKEGIVALRIIGKGNKERIVPVHAVLSNYISSWLREKNGHKSEYLFTGKKEGHVHRITGWRWFRQFKTKAGYNGRLTPHKLRHTFATRLYRKETPIFDLQNMLGHADPRTTGIYAHVDYEALQTHIQKLL
jgi:integrase/recombinase XerD